jgi:ferric-dicitrate binding protein FerR (iron transport regulator)
MNQSYWKEQLHRYRTRSLTVVEEELLWSALADPANAEGWEMIFGEMFREQTPGADYRLEDWESVLQVVFASDRTSKRGKAIWMPGVRRFTAAAAVAAGVLLAGYWVLTKFISHESPGIVQTAAVGDIPAPTTNRATITLAGGQQVYLDSAVNGALAQQGNAQLVKEANGQVAYKVATTTDRALLYNTLTNPRGSRVVTLTLSDGTKVWLNAESSLRYPVIFAGGEWTVEMTGEGYFEVSKDASKPFKVQVKGEEQVDVLGTDFNINAYPDEKEIKTTLFQGSVRVSRETSTSVVGVNTNNEKLSVVLRPGQQTALVVGVNTNNRDFKVLSNVDLEAVMAWKNGLFAFHNADLPTVMRQLSRWYNIDVTYEGNVPREKFLFNGKMGKDLSLDTVLDLLANARVHYRIEPGNKLVIRP